MLPCVSQRFAALRDVVNPVTQGPAIMSQADQPEVVDTNGASSISGVPVATLCTLRSRGGGPPFLRIGRSIRYRVDLLRTWRDAHLVTSTADTSAAERVDVAGSSKSQPARGRKARASKRVG